MQTLNAVALAAWLKETAPPLLLDVREDWEYAIAHLPGSLLIPMGQIPGRYESLPRDRPVVVYCHHGMRSAQIVTFLSSRGFTQVHNLTGGIDAWATEVDPALPRY